MLAAAELLRESADGEVSTRAICERSGVQAPTLYHHFGNKQGLLDAVVVAGFRDNVGVAAAGDPVAALRSSWDRHVRYGLDNPSSYVPRTIAPTAERLLVDLFNEVARQGRLRVAPDVAARQFASATIGATVSLLADPHAAWVDGLRDTVLAAVLTDAPAEAAPSGGSSSAVALLAALDEDRRDFTDGEVTLLREWLHRLAGSGTH